MGTPLYPPALTMSSPKPFKIDIHTHILPPDLHGLAEKYGYGGFIELEHSADGPTKMWKDGVFFREVDANVFDLEARMRDMCPHAGCTGGETPDGADVHV